MSQLSLFHLQIKTRRFNETTIQILESVLVSKDVKSLMEVRSSLTEFLRSESLCVIRTIADKTVQQKLLVLEFFVRAFAIVGDSESCLALRYEALVMRQLKSSSCEWLRVSYDEWLNFAEHALDSGFHSIAGKACENALLCFQKNDLVEPETYKFSEDLGAVRKIKRLKDFAMTSISSRSVQAQAAEYLKRKRTEKSKTDSFCKENQCLASISFRNGIKKRNLQKLHEHQSILRINDELDINNMDEVNASLYMLVCCKFHNSTLNKRVHKYRRPAYDASVAAQVGVPRVEKQVIFSLLVLLGSKILIACIRLC